MRLAAYSDILPQNLVSALEECRILTDNDLIFSTPYTILHKLPAGTITLKELLACIDAIVAQVSVDGQSALELLEIEKYTDLLSSGIAPLDTLLSGGLKTGCVYELSGDRGSGKSDLALCWAVRTLTERVDCEAFWLDTTGDLSVDRVEAIFPSNSSALTRFRLSLAFDLDAVYDALVEIESQGSSTKLLVIAAITPILSPHLTGISARGHAMMVSFMRQLRVLAKSKELAVLVVNTSTATHPGRNAGRKPSLGPTFPFMSDATLWMSKPFPQSPEIYSVELLRSRVSTQKPGYRCLLRQHNSVFEEGTAPQENE